MLDPDVPMHLGRRVGGSQGFCHGGRYVALDEARCDDSRRPSSNVVLIAAPLHLCHSAYIISRGLLRILREHIDRCEDER